MPKREEELLRVDETRMSSCKSLPNRVIDFKDLDIALGKTYATYSGLTRKT